MVYDELNLNLVSQKHRASIAARKVTSTYVGKLQIAIYTTEVKVRKGLQLAILALPKSMREAVSGFNAVACSVFSEKVFDNGLSLLQDVIGCWDRSSDRSGCQQCLDPVPEGWHNLLFPVP